MPEPARATAHFDFAPRTRVVFGAGSAERAGELARALGQRVFLVSDPGLVAAGHVERVEASLRKAGCEVRRWAEVRADPTEDDVARCRAALGDWPADVLVGLGGGSPIDVAKGCAFLREGGGRMADYRGSGTAKGRLLPLVAVPTTAGTGSEVQSFALIEETGTHQKMACGDPQATPRVAILDPSLTLTLPHVVTAFTGLDAIGHAVETMVTTRRTPMSRVFSREAFRLANAALPRVLQKPGDLAARGDMLLAACLAGLAIESSMLGAAHSLANPLTARLGLAHGEAVGLMLPRVVRFNAAVPEAAAGYAELAAAAGLPDAAALAARLDQLLDLCGLDRALAERGLDATRIPALAAEAARQWTAQFNPRLVSVADFEELLAAKP